MSKGYKFQDRLNLSKFIILGLLLENKFFNDLFSNKNPLLTYFSFVYTKYLIPFESINSITSLLPDFPI